MDHVTGIGGLFYRSRDPEATRAWYRTHLGIGSVFVDGVPWHQEAGPTVFEPFDQDTDYFGDKAQQWMLNLRVQDLDGLIAKLAAAGIAVETRDEWNSEVGRFARIHDPEGNPVELWEPAKAEDV